MREDFAVFILTHGRATKQKSYKMLVDAGYTGRLYFVIDDLDEQMDEYKKLYGERVLVFDKEAQYEKTDIMTNAKELSAAVYARNWIAEHAGDYGVKYFAICDDDIGRISYRFPYGKTLKEVKIRKTADGLFSAICDFLEKSKLACTSPAVPGSFIGGVNKSVLSGQNWNTCNFMFYRTESPVKYRGLLFDDLITHTDVMKSGRPVFATTLAEVVAAECGSNEGGMHETYEGNGFYVSCFMTVIANPDCWHVMYDGDYRARRSGDAAAPKILNEKWRKADAG